MRSLRRLIGTCLLTAGTASPSFAQDQEPLSVKSPGAALALSALGTVVPIGLAVSGVAGEEGGAGLFLGGLVLGPSLGYLYAGETGSAFKGIGLRAGVLAATVVASNAICNTGCSLDELGDAILVLGAGLLTTSVLAIADIVRVEGKVKARNERVARAAPSLRLAYLPETRGLGVLLTIRR